MELTVDSLLDEVRLAGLSEKYGTPLYVYDGAVIRRQLETLRSLFPAEAGVEVYYSMKCNPLLGIAQLLRREGCRVEVASAGELAAVLEAGYPPADILFTSPGKTAEELEWAVDLGICSINAESLEEIRRIDRIAAARGRVADIAIRVNPNLEQKTAGIRMSGVSSQFGIDEEELSGVLAELPRLQSVRLIGFHVYFGTQILSADALLAQLEDTFELALRYAEGSGTPLQFLDIGGGWGVPYFAHEAALDLDRLRAGIAELWLRYAGRLRGTRIAVESGRFLLAEAGVFLTKVLYRKVSKGSTYLVCDGGSNQHASSAFLGRYIRHNFPMRVLGRSGPSEPVTVTGPLCTATDVLGQKVELPAAAVGDVICVDKSGAYGLTHSPVLFLSHALPAEVLLHDGGEYVLRERGRVHDVIRGQLPLD
ncbi:type III PLP-dependent enzyme [Paenibacillus mucilaginosus]|uniref:Decarboxylase n=2 Tax=Paenibacillus mucilaginosus TaxID=61624 RepID=I0BMH1_9BACL|nr:type III PLP-dependent enzyme [Paenibacillus mucilaginosus]AEI43600.1 Orn/DAP/Arg decarboxylase 2 [Paenibacillus mucilaginosus KNP414]AFH63568.1 decarboxylase [Paenibacillus mucilaginosus K02]MCG7216749.1 type III PLP-dependent enzyme [Paenibacillus mucilaginosus]WDM25135.1 type III PLP-dependent enzyme [Paenibacillus mucilaginosus]